MHMRFRNIYPTTEIDQGYLRKIYVKHFSKKCKTWLEAINYNLRWQTGTGKLDIYTF